MTNNFATGDWFMPDAADNKALFVRHLEGWINEKVKEKADGHNDKIPLEIRNDFQTAIRANIDYHRQMSEAAKAIDDSHSFESYHKLMADIYETLCD